MRPPSKSTTPKTATVCRRCHGTREDLAIVRERGAVAFRIVRCPDCRDAA